MNKKENVEFNLEYIRNAMNNFEDDLREKMQIKVDEIKEYIEKQSKEIENLKEHLKIDEITQKVDKEYVKEQSKTIETMNNYINSFQNNIVGFEMYQPWEPEPDIPAPILNGTPETISFIKEQQKEIEELKNNLYHDDLANKYLTLKATSIPKQRIRNRIENLDKKANNIAGSYQYASNFDHLEIMQQNVIELRTKAIALRELL